MDWINRLLDAGCHLIIKQRYTGDVVLTITAEIDGENYHKDIIFDNVYKMNDLGDKVVDAILLSLKRKKIENDSKRQKSRALSRQR